MNPALLWGLAMAAPTPSTWDGSLSLSGTLDWGNLDQVRGIGRGHLARHDDAWGNDLDANAALVWLRPQPGAPFVSIGREIAAMDRLTWSPDGLVEIGGLVRYESNLLRGVDHRGLLGAGVGARFVERGETRMKAVVAAVGEGTRYRSADFQAPTEASSRDRGSFGVAGLVEGSHTWDRQRSSARGSALIVVNPTAVREHRTVVDGALTVRVVGPVGAQLAATWLYERVVLVDVDRHGVRANAGISVSFGHREEEPG